MENHSYSQIIGNTSAPYMNAFARRGELFTNMNAISHPSLPNYLALTSGSTLGCTSDGFGNIRMTVVMIVPTSIERHMKFNRGHLVAVLCATLMRSCIGGEANAYLWPSTLL